MHDVCNYIGWMVFNHRELKFDLTEEQKRQCGVSSQRKVFYKWTAHPELTTLPAYNLAQVIADIASVAQGSMNLTDSDTFMNYYNMSGKTLKVDPKFFLFSAHAETVAPLIHFYNL